MNMYILVCRVGRLWLWLVHENFKWKGQGRGINEKLKIWNIKRVSGYLWEWVIDHEIGGAGQDRE